MQERRQRIICALTHVECLFVKLEISDDTGQRACEMAREPWMSRIAGTEKTVEPMFVDVFLVSPAWAAGYKCLAGDPLWVPCPKVI